MGQRGNGPTCETAFKPQDHCCRHNNRSHIRSPFCRTGRSCSRSFQMVVRCRGILRLCMACDINVLPAQAISMAFVLDKRTRAIASSGCLTRQASYLYFFSIGTPASFLSRSLKRSSSPHSRAYWTFRAKDVLDKRGCRRLVVKMCLI